MFIDVEYLARALACVYPAISTDIMRAHLNSALLDFADGACVATDGHRLAVHEIPRAIVELTEGETLPRIMLSRDDVDRVVKLLGRKHVLPTCEVTLTGGNVTIAYNGTSTTCRVVDAAFPPWRGVMPSASTEAAPGNGVALNPAYLADAAKSFDRAKRGTSVVVHCGSAQDLDPIRITSDEYSALTWIVMPCRSGRDVADKQGRRKPYSAPRYCESTADRDARVRREEEEALRIAASFGALVQDTAE